MKILLVSDVYHPRVNGVTTSIETFARRLRTDGQEVRLVCPDYGPDPSHDESWIVRVPSRRIPFDPEDRFMSLRAGSSLLPEIAAWGPDLVHVNTPFVAHLLGRRLARQLNLPLVVTYHTFFEEYLHHYVPLLPRRLSHAMARRFTVGQCRDASQVIVPSNAMREVLTGYGVTTPMTVLPTPVAVPEVPGDGGAFRERYAIAADRPVLIHVGRIAHEKNIGFLLEVTAALRPTIPDILLVLAGEGPAIPSLRRRAEQLGLSQNTLFVGYQDRKKDLWDCFAAGDVFVFSSRTETQGLVLLEAMALGIPVVSTAELGTRDVLQPESGARVVPEEVEAFATATADLLANPDVRRQLGRLGSDYVERRWAVAPITERLEVLYRSLDRAKKPSLASTRLADAPDPTRV